MHPATQAVINQLLQCADAQEAGLLDSSKVAIMLRYGAQALERQDAEIERLMGLQILLHKEMDKQRDEIDAGRDRANRAEAIVVCATPAQ